MPSKPSGHKRTGPPVSPVGRRNDSREWTVITESSRETDRMGQAIGRALAGGETLALSGQLGAGKTALVRGIAQGLGADPADVSSPTFVLIHEYRGRLPLAHVDLYRLNNLRELESTGLAEYFAGPTVMAIEWAERGLGWLPEDRLEIQLRHRTVGSRTIRLQATGPVSARLLGAARSGFGRPTSRSAKPGHKKAAS